MTIDRLTILITQFSLMLTSSAEASQTTGIDVWAVDSLVKVFPDATRPGLGTKAVAEIARGEHATLQIVVRTGAPISNLRAELAPLTCPQQRKRTLPAGSVRFVGYVPVDRPIQTPPSDQLRKPPADFPDPLLEVKRIDLEAERAQPIWITIPVPTDAPAGIYGGDVAICGQTEDRPVSTSVPVQVKVFDVTVGSSRLWTTNWFNMHWPHMKISPEPDSEEYWDLLRKYARNMAEHRQNVALISPLALAEYGVADNGQLRIDFSRFDKWVTIFKEEGVIGCIEGGHLGWRKGDWVSPFVVQIRKIENNKVVSASVDPASTEADAFYSKFLPALIQHLRDKGWLETYLQHLADEPIAENAESYRAIAQLVHKYGDPLQIIEACHTKDLVGSIDIWVPMLNYLHQDQAHYLQRQRQGEEVWFYTCVFPQGEYANRFIEQPLIKTRLLHWINFRYGITGYLHWGYNWWTQEDPFKKTTREHPGPPYLPAGDAWIVYPGKDGPIDSIRFEAMRDGIADYELLCMLDGQDHKLAIELASKHVQAFDRYDCNVEAFRASRRQLLEALSKPPEVKEMAVTLSGDVPLKFVYVRAGNFWMGAQPHENDHETDEARHEVKLTQDYWLGRFEVTNRQFRAFRPDHVSQGFTDWEKEKDFNGDDQPVVAVDLADVEAFCRWASEKTGRRIRLATEAEWEYACRAGSRVSYCFGEDRDQLTDYAWYSENSGWMTHPVGQKRPNAWGLHDMHGNVAEWVSDWYNYYPGGPQTDPKGPPTQAEAWGGRHCWRECSWSSRAFECRCATRDWAEPTYKSAALGFRVACDP